MASYRLYEIGTHYLPIRMTHTVIQYCLSPRSFDNLPNDLRGTLYDLFRLVGQVANRNFYGGEGLENAVETILGSGAELVELTDDEGQAWRDAMVPLEDRFIEENEALGLPATEFVREAKERSARYVGWTDQQLWDHVWNNPVPGIITT